MRFSLFMVIMLFSGLFPQAVLAGSASGLVTEVYVHSSGGNGEGVLMFRTENHFNAPDCNTAFDGLEWAVSLEKQSGRAMLTAVLSAQAQRLDVFVMGQNDCNDWGDRERVSYVKVIGPTPSN